jgi:hypothetical protein
MEWMMQILSECLVSVLGVILTALAARLGKQMGKVWRERAQSEAVQSVAKSCVAAVEQMYRELGGEEKLERALHFCETLLTEKGISISAEGMRIALEAALCEWKGAFQEK